MSNSKQMLYYYCDQLSSEWAQKKALAYLRILAEAEGGAPASAGGAKPIESQKGKRTKTAEQSKK